MMAERTESKAPAAWAWAGGVFLVALAIRLAHLAHFRTLEFFQILGLDARFYHEWATALAQGRWNSSEPYFQGPLLPYALSFLYRVGGSDPSVARVAHAVLGAATCALVFRLGERLSGRGVALLASLLYAFYGYLLFLEGHLVVAPWLAFLLAAAVWVMVEGGDRPAPWRWAVAGVLTGLLCVGRGTFVLALLLALLGAWRWLKPGVDPVPWRRVGLLLAGVGVAILPVTARNVLVGHEFVPLTTNGGINYYIAHHEGATGTFDPIEGVDFFQAGAGHDGGSRALASARAGRELSPAQASRWWLMEGLRFDREHPLANARLTMRRLLMLLSNYEIPQIENFDWAKDESVFLRWNPVRFGWLMALALVGAAMGWRRGRRLPTIVAGALLLSLLPFFVTARYRVVLAPMVVLLAAQAAVGLWHGVRGATRGASLRAVGAFVLLAVLLNLYAPAGIEANSRALRHYSRGVIAMQEGDYARAATAYRQSLAEDANHVPTIANLAFCLGRLGQHAEAVEYYRQVLQLEPGNRRILRFLAESLIALRRDREAELLLQRIITEMPEDLWAYSQLAGLYEMGGRIEQARGLWQAVLRAAPEGPLRQTALEKLQALEP